MGYNLMWHQLYSNNIFGNYTFETLKELMNDLKCLCWILKLTLNGKWKPGVESSLKLYIISSCTLHCTETWTTSRTWLYNKCHHINHQYSNNKSCLFLIVTNFLKTSCNYFDWVKYSSMCIICDVLQPIQLHIIGNPHLNNETYLWMRCHPVHKIPHNIPL